MNPVIKNMINAIEAFDTRRRSLSNLVSALDDLRRNSDFSGHKLDSFYSTLEEVNSVAIYQDRELNEQEVQKIKGKLVTLLSIIETGE